MKIFKNVHAKSVYNNIADNIMKEAKRLGTDKQIEDLLKPENVKKIIKEKQASQNVQKGMKI